jgi:ribonuclease R
MNPEELKKETIELFQMPGYSPLTAGEISKVLKLKDARAKRLQKALNELVKDGQIVCVRKNRYSLGEPLDLVTGKVELTRAGNGFVTDRKGGTDILVMADDLGTALPGDVVVARLHAGAQATDDGIRHGKVIKILERSRHDIVGTLRSTGRFLYVLPLDSRYKQDFYVSDANGAKINDRVVVRFVGWENKHVNPEAEIVDVIGPMDNPSLDTISIVRQFGFTEEFPDEVIRQAESASALMDAPGAREDLRDTYVLTVDPERARDFDDALSLEKDANGNRVLGVHIADVSHFVRRDTVLDKEARRRGNSIYLPDKVIPMLPEQLSNGICSLNPDVDRLTLSAFITIDGVGNIIGKRFAKTIIRSKLRLTYEEAFAVLEGKRETGVGKQKKAVPSISHVPADGRRLLKEIHALAQQFRAKRFARYALDLDVPENEIVIGKDGMIQEIRVVPNDISHQMIEECMVAANEAVVMELDVRHIGVIARVHEPPREDKIQDLSVQLAGMGFKPGDLYSRQNLAKFLKSVVDHPLAYSVRTAVLRSMNRAVYKATSSGHYALAKKFYGHFTSPIRRYPDLILHRQLAASLSREHGRFYERQELAVIALSCTETEQRADQAERELMEIKKYRYLEQELKLKKPRIYDAVVVSCVNFGMFVEILGLQVQGLVHVSELSKQYVKFDRQAAALKAGKDVYKSGRRVKVYATRVDFDKRRIDFALAL